ncbi:hypothetical protein [Bradyrhizobium commune]|uniref:Uncharacterized protein n=1 Tax=Bradyrhizobium commune TaxID=83627 RepID=A0A7S9D0D1_9BRAD|nr:hypothetical protein [Bradyrhizobium commune]QPF88877.1 hypothetical protein IC761_20370 [Bradyrhizobium commune]
MTNVGLPVESFIIERLADGGWRVTQRRADLADIPIAEFVSRLDAEEWVNWKQGVPKLNPYSDR